MLKADLNSFSKFYSQWSLKVARLDFLGEYVPSLSINYVAMSKDMGKRVPQLYYIKKKIAYDLGFTAIGVATATRRYHYVFYLSLCFSLPEVFLRNRLRESVPAIIASIMAKFEQILWERFRNILKRSFKRHKNSEIACYRHNELFFKKMISFGNAASSHSGLIPLKTAYKKRGELLRAIASKKNFINLH